jgi:hypothetical protein
MSLSKRIREHLLTYGPLTVGALANDLIPHVRYGPATIRNTLGRMADAYISDWVRSQGVRGHYSAVWDVVEVPLHADHPRKK